MTGEGDEVSGILYYIPDLWEEYLESKIIDLNLSSQEVIKVFHNGKEYKNTFRPDFVFKTDDDQPFMILDAKYKPRWMAVHKSSSFDYRAKAERKIYIRYCYRINKGLITDIFTQKGIINVIPFLLCKNLFKKLFTSEK